MLGTQMKLLADVVCLMSSDDNAKVQKLKCMHKKIVSQEIYFTDKNCALFSNMKLPVAPVYLSFRFYLLAIQKVAYHWMKNIPEHILFQRLIGLSFFFLPQKRCNAIDGCTRISRAKVRAECGRP